MKGTKSHSSEGQYSLKHFYRALTLKYFTNGRVDIQLQLLVWLKYSILYKY